MDNSTGLTFTWSGPDGIDVSNVAVFPNTSDNTVTNVLMLENVTLIHEGDYNCSVAYSDMPDDISTSESATLEAIS